MCSSRDFLEWHLPEGKLELLKLDRLTHFGFFGLENCAGGWQGMLFYGAGHAYCANHVCHICDLGGFLKI